MCIIASQTSHFLPRGPSQCVTTSRENNVHSADLTHGNIQPNHLSMNLENLQVSMMILLIDINPSV